VIEKNNLDKTNAWPFVEAKKLLRERKVHIEKKGKIILQTGYGPSGLPHIGTFGEVARTSMMVNALNYLTDIPKEIITFSDDMDGLRKIPDNVPNQDLLKNNLHKPLTQVPDPFNKFNSFFASTKGHALVLSKLFFSITTYNNKISQIWCFY
jgi:lysyl-tRNA synthetase class 1